MLLKNRKQIADSVQGEFDSIIANILEGKELNHVLLTTKLGIEQLFELIKYKYQYSKDIIKENIFEFMLKIADHSPSLQLDAFKYLIELDKDDLDSLLNNRPYVHDFTFKYFENIRTFHSETEDLIQDNDDEDMEETLEIQLSRIKSLINFIIEHNLKKVYQYVNKSSLSTSMRFNASFESEDEFIMAFKMDIRYDALDNSDWLGGESRKYALDHLFRELYGQYLIDEAEMYCYSDDEHIGFVTRLQNDGKGYDIEVAGKSGTRILFDKKVYLDDLDNLAELVDDLKSDVDHFSKSYDDFLNMLREIIADKRKIFDELIFEAFEKHPRVFEEIDRDFIFDLVEQKQMGILEKDLNSVLIEENLIPQN